MELREKIARIICRAAGADLDGPICDIFVPDDPECIYPWAIFRKDADAILNIPEIREALILFGSDTAAQDRD